MARSDRDASVVRCPERQAAWFVVCIKNDGHPASLEVRKLYQFLPDRSAAARGMIRVIDESGEDYLYPEEFFVPIRVPLAAAKAFPRAV